MTLTNRDRKALLLGGAAVLVIVTVWLAGLLYREMEHQRSRYHDLSAHYAWLVENRSEISANANVLALRLKGSASKDNREQALDLARKGGLQGVFEDDVFVIQRASSQRAFSWLDQLQQANVGVETLHMTQQDNEKTVSVRVRLME